MSTMTALVLEPILGPVCNMQDAVEDSGGCYHDSCQDIECNCHITMAEGPLCGEHYYQGGCDHESCTLIEPPQTYCFKHHSQQLVVDSGSGRGFAGGL